MTQLRTNGTRRPRWALTLPPFAFAAALFLLIPAAHCDDSLWPADPLDAGDSVAGTPGQAGPSGGDACLAGQTPAGRPWSLVDVVNQALCHNPQTRQAWANARAQAALLGAALAAYIPSVTASGTVSHGKGSTGGGSQNSLLSGQTSSLGFGSGGFGGSQPTQTRMTPLLSVNYLLFDFGGRDAKAESARQALEAANWTHAATLQTVLFSAVQAYYQLFATQEALASAETAEKSSATAFEAAKVRHDIGAAALADQLQAQTAYAQAKFNRQKAYGDAQNALGALANTLGLEADAPVRIEAPALAEPSDGWQRNVHALIDEAKAARPELAAAEAQVKAAEAGIAGAKAGAMPSLSLVGNYGYSESSVYNGAQTWAVGVQLSVPLFTGFANTYQIHNAEQLAAAQQANRDKLVQSVALDVWRAYHDLNTARETFHSSRDLLASASQSEKVALGRYKAGAGNVLDLLNAQASLASARFQHIQARYNWHIGKARLAQALGHLDLAEAQTAGAVLGKE